MAGNTIDTELFERIVREVVKRLTAQGVSVSHSASQPAETERLCLADRVISTATLAGRLTGVAEVFVPLRAVVTPAAKDMLKEQQIELKYTPEDSNL